MSKMIGYSLSACVRDILHNNVLLSDVVKIVASTRVETLNQWEEVHSVYSDSWWKRNPDRAWTILQKLLESGRVEQPRLVDSEYRRGRQPIWEEC